MVCGHYSIHFDCTGFPLVQRANWRYAIGLWPVSKYQFERFMAEQGPHGGRYTDGWYRELLKLNPRAPWRCWGERPWELFLTGVERAAITSFLRYLGPGYRLPTGVEWRRLWRARAELQGERPALLAGCHGAPPALRYWLASGLYPLTHQGLLEWVEGEGPLRCIG